MSWYIFDLDSVLNLNLPRVDQIITAVLQLQSDETLVVRRSGVSALLIIKPYQFIFGMSVGPVVCCVSVSVSVVKECVPVSVSKEKILFSTDVVLLSWMSGGSTSLLFVHRI